LLHLKNRFGNGGAMDAWELLDANGIKLDNYGLGEHPGPCPRCSHLRQPRHQKLKCLSVKIDEHGACWHCNHCGWCGPSKETFGAIYHYPGFQKVRHRSGHEPRFHIRHRNGNGWQPGAGGADTGKLYRFEEAEEAIALGYRIAIVEGEKDANSLWMLGIPATCSPHGASEPGDKSKWTEKHSEQLRGADVIIFNDNDPSGYAHADATCRSLAGIAKRICRLDLALHWPGMPASADVSDWLAKGHTREELDALIEQAPDYIAKQGPLLDYVDISKWIGAPVPVREWAALNRIPARNVTVLSGTGGIGKTILAMMLAAAIVLARDWFGIMPEPGPVMFWSGEEPEEEMHRRFADIIEHLNAIYPGTSYRDLIDGGLHLIDMAGKDAMLAVPDRNGRMQPTSLFELLLAEAKRIKPKLVILDNRNKVYGGNISNPTQVSEFLTMLHGFAIAADTTILLILHPSVSGIAASKDSAHQGLAGAMNWHDLPRGRMYFEKIKADDDREIDKDIRALACKKNNYGPDDETITLRWKTGTHGSGVFVVDAKPGSIEKMAADSKADEFFLISLQRLCEQNRGPFSHKPKSNNYAPTAFAGLPEAKAAGIKKIDLIQALERLIDGKRIIIETYGPPSRKATKLVIPSAT
jgi:RecA-family ATPase